MYVENASEMEQLDRYVNDVDGRPVLITGDSGSGICYFFFIYLFVAFIIIIGFFFRHSQPNLHQENHHY